MTDALSQDAADAAQGLTEAGREVNSATARLERARNRISEAKRAGIPDSDIRSILNVVVQTDEGRSFVKMLIAEAKP
jgi:hypothetical protein